MNMWTSFQRPPFPLFSFPLIHQVPFVLSLKISPKSVHITRPPPPAPHPEPQSSLPWTAVVALLAALSAFISAPSPPTAHITAPRIFENSKSYHVTFLLEISQWLSIAPNKMQTPYQPTAPSCRPHPPPAPPCTILPITHRRLHLPSCSQTVASSFFHFISW